jgi:TolB-like protein/class 3 adenylate cyclase/cytochrome c-type biogenesis protein CcmH/NrfG
MIAVMTEQRKLAAILASDVVGYSRLTGTDEEGTVARLRALKAELLDPTVAAHRGRIVKTAGDGMLVEFASVVDAVRAAIAVQSDMAKRAAGIAPERQIRFRIGIHLGDVLVESDGDLMGDGVNIAARLEGICEPGGICLSEDAWRQVRDRIDAPFADLGDKELKNIARPVRVYALEQSAPSRRRPGPIEVEDSPSRAMAPDLRRGGAKMEGAAPDKTGAPRLSLVVLPFANMSGDAEQEYFADGLTEDLTTELSRIPGAFVIARNTAFTFKGKPVDVKAIGRDLGVRYALEGSVRKAGSRVRFNAQLIDAESGAHVWADRFDRELVDLFDLQDSVTQELAGVMNVQLVDAEMRRGQAKLDPDAFDLILRARAAANRGASRENFAESLRLYEAALARDPDNVSAMCGIVIERSARVSSLWSEDRAADIAAAEAMAVRAQSLAPGNPEVRFALGFLRRIHMRFEESIAELSAVLRDNPNNAGAHNEMGWALGFSGRDREAIHHFEESIRRNPRDPMLFLGYFGIGYVRYEMGAHEAAVAALRQSIGLNPHFSWPYLILAASLWALGREAEARDAIAGYFRTNPAVKTIAAMKANPVSPRLSQSPSNPFYDALHHAGMPEA